MNHELTRRKIKHHFLNIEISYKGFKTSPLITILRIMRGKKEAISTVQHDFNTSGQITWIKFDFGSGSRSPPTSSLFECSWTSIWYSLNPIWQCKDRFISCSKFFCREPFNLSVHQPWCCQFYTLDPKYQFMIENREDQREIQLY